MGRPSLYTDELAAEICDRLSVGESLIEICQDDRMPDEVTVYRWLRRDDREEFRNSYARAREAQGDHYFDRIGMVARTPQMGEIVTIKEDGKREVRQEDMLGHRRLVVDSLKWQAAKLRPKVYGEATLLKHADADGNNLDLAAQMAAARARTKPEK